MKIYSKVCMVAALAAAMCSFVSCNKGPEKYALKLYPENPYLAEVWWGDDYDPEAATEKLNSRYNQPAEAGGCSSWHQGNFHGRNIDWTMKDFATLIIHTPKTAKVAHASVGLMAGNPAITKAFIDSVKVIPEEMRAWLPAAVVDGINDAGVAINHNIVPYDGKPYEANGDMASIMVCRYVLDNCGSAQEAVDALKSKKITQAVVKVANDYSHFFISDPTESFVVEWVNGEFVATEFKGDGNGNFVSDNGTPAIMTNYFVAEAEKYGLATKEFFMNHPTAAGVERQQTIAAQLPAAATLEDHINICKSVWYRQFCQGKTSWYTEDAGYYGYNAELGKAYWYFPDASCEENIHIMADDDIYGAAKDMLASDVMTNYYNDFNTNWDKCDPANTYWYTQHSVVYDVQNIKGYIIMQEGLYSDKVVEISVE